MLASAPFRNSSGAIARPCASSIFSEFISMPRPSSILAFRFRSIEEQSMTTSKIERLSMILTNSGNDLGKDAG